jgi:penicillin-binding protein 1A
MVGMLSGVVARGTGRAAAMPWPAAGKTGTSQESRDAWFIGFTRDLVAGVWVGNDDGRPMKGVTGGGLPTLLWADFMRAALAGTPPKPLTGIP